jgi:hypothetical protein
VAEKKNSQWAAFSCVSSSRSGSHQKGDGKEEKRKASDSRATKKVLFCHHWKFTYRGSA